MSTHYRTLTHKHIVLARSIDLQSLPDMVQHNDKWKKKASREYHKKHGTLPVGRGRGRGRGRGGRPFNEPEQTAEQEQDIPSEGDPQSGESGEESENEEQQEDCQPHQYRSKYARRKVESNAWRFEVDEPPDPHLGTSSVGLKD